MAMMGRGIRAEAAKQVGSQHHTFPKAPYPLGLISSTVDWEC